MRSGVRKRGRRRKKGRGRKTEEHEVEEKVARKKEEKPEKKKKEMTEEVEEDEEEEERDGGEGLATSAPQQMDLSQHMIDHLINCCDWSSRRHRACSLASCPPLRAG